MLLGERITELRKSKGMSQGELAERLHVHQSMVTRWEKGRIQPKAQTLEKIAQALDTPIQELANGLEVAETLILREIDPQLARLISQLHRLDAKSQDALKTVLEAMFTRTRVHDALTQ